MSAARTANNLVDETSNVEMGGQEQILLWARPLTGTPTIPAILIRWTELW